MDIVARRQRGNQAAAALACALSLSALAPAGAQAAQSGYFSAGELGGGAGRNAEAAYPTESATAAPSRLYGSSAVSSSAYFMYPALSPLGYSAESFEPRFLTMSESMPPAGREGIYPWLRLGGESSGFLIPGNCSYPFRRFSPSSPPASAPSASFAARSCGILEFAGAAVRPVNDSGRSFDSISALQVAGNTLYACIGTALSRYGISSEGRLSFKGHDSLSSLSGVLSDESGVWAKIAPFLGNTNKPYWLRVDDPSIPLRLPAEWSPPSAMERYRDWPAVSFLDFERQTNSYYRLPVSIPGGCIASGLQRIVSFKEDAPRHRLLETCVIEAGTDALALAACGNRVGALLSDGSLLLLSLSPDGQMREMGRAPSTIEPSPANPMQRHASLAMAPGKAWASAGGWDLELFSWADSSAPKSEGRVALPHYCILGAFAAGEGIELRYRPFGEGTRSELWLQYPSGRWGPADLPVPAGMRVRHVWKGKAYLSPERERDGKVELDGSRLFVANAEGGGLLDAEGLAQTAVSAVGGKALIGWLDFEGPEALAAVASSGGVSLVALDLGTGKASGWASAGTDSAFLDGPVLYSSGVAASMTGRAWSLRRRVELSVAGESADGTEWKLKRLLGKSERGLIVTAFDYLAAREGAGGKPPEMVVSLSESGVSPYHLEYSPSLLPGDGQPSLTELDGILFGAKETYPGSLSSTFAYDPAARRFSTSLTESRGFGVAGGRVFNAPADGPWDLLFYTVAKGDQVPPRGTTAE